MTDVKTNKPLMAEMLVRRVFGDAAGFERMCAQRGVSIEDAVSQALRSWVGQPLPVTPVEPAMPVLGLLPDPTDCPPGQEAHFIAVGEADLEKLRAKQQRCFRDKDMAGVASTTKTIETYIQTLAALRERQDERVA